MTAEKEIREAERAEVVQAVKALFIPSSLFLACVMSAAATFLIYHHEPLGWAFAVVAATTIITAFVALIKFQNQYRVRGVLLERENERSDGVTTEAGGALLKVPASQIETTMASVGSTFMSSAHAHPERSEDTTTCGAENAALHQPITVSQTAQRH